MNDLMNTYHNTPIEVVPNPDSQAVQLLRELERLQKQLDETRAMLRYVCGEVGDNDWPDDLHLADVVEKHLFRHWPHLT